MKRLAHILMILTIAIAVIPTTADVVPIKKNVFMDDFQVFKNNIVKVVAKNFVNEKYVLTVQDIEGTFRFLLDVPKHVYRQIRITEHGNKSQFFHVIAKLDDATPILARQSRARYRHDYYITLKHFVPNGFEMKFKVVAEIYNGFYCPDTRQQRGDSTMVFHKWLEKEKRWEVQKSRNIQRLEEAFKLAKNSGPGKYRVVSPEATINIDIN